MIVNTATVLRDGSEQEIPIDEIVVGDVIKLSAGDMIPADVVLIDSRDFLSNNLASQGKVMLLKRFVSEKPTVKI